MELYKNTIHPFKSVTYNYLAERDKQFKGLKNKRVKMLLYTKGAVQSKVDYAGDATYEKQCYTGSEVQPKKCYDTSYIKNLPVRHKEDMTKSKHFLGNISNVYKAPIERFHNCCKPLEDKGVEEEDWMII